MNPLRAVPAGVWLAAVLLFGAGVAQAQRTVTCASESHRTAYCDLDTRGGVQLTRQLSHAGCWQGDTWGYDGRGVWVSNGCRAEFTAGGRWDDGRRERDHDDRNAAIAGAVVLGLIGAAVLADKHDDRHDDDRYDSGDYGNGRGYTVTCESQDGRYRRCDNVGRAHVEIDRVLSRADCRYGQSWGVDRGAIWVDRGCRARFAVY